MKEKGGGGKRRGKRKEKKRVLIPSKCAILFREYRRLRQYRFHIHRSTKKKRRGGGGEKKEPDVNTSPLRWIRFSGREERKKKKREKNGSLNFRTGTEKE